MTDFTTRYFEGEGRPYIRPCIEHAFAWAAAHDIRTIVMFSGSGEGPYFAATNLLPRGEYRHLRLVAVTPPYGKAYIADPSEAKPRLVVAGIPQAIRDELRDLGVPILAAQLPFKPTHDGSVSSDGRIGMSSEWSRVTAALSILGGGFPLAIQAVLMACDAGEVRPGELIVAVTADTALSVTACRTETFLSPVHGLLVEHIISRPIRYSVSKPGHRHYAPPSPPPDATRPFAPESPLLFREQPPQLNPPAAAVAAPRKRRRKAKKTAT